MGSALFILLLPMAILWLFIFLSSYILCAHQKAFTVLLLLYSFLLSLFFFIIVFFHLDTFLYTTTGWSVYSFSFLNNIILLVVLIDISVILVIKKREKILEFFSLHRKKLCGAMVVILVCSSILGTKRAYTSLREMKAADNFEINRNIENPPNIILFCPDGVAARHLGVYGYEKDTTPNLEKLGNFTIYTRAYCNASNSRASTMSILTGKSPLATKLIGIIDVFHGKDSFQHLPNILDKLGYYNVDLNDGYWTSSSQSNLELGFHLENSRKTDFATWTFFLRRVRRLLPLEMYMLSDIFEKYRSKMLYMAGLTKTAWILLPTRSDIRAIRNALRSCPADFENDRKRIDIAKEIIEEIDQPLFIRIHLTATHPTVLHQGSFEPIGERPQFTYSLEEGEEKLWNVYDNAIILVDEYFGEIVQALDQANKLDNTLIIFHTDHWQKYVATPLVDLVKYPLPLIVHLPHQKGKTVVNVPVQYLDIAPSILSLLKQPIPEWMEGDVIFGESIGNLHLPSRPLIATVDNAWGILYGYRIIKDNECYIFSTLSGLGNLYDVSGDAYDLRPLDNPALERELRHILLTDLKANKVQIGQAALLN